MPVVRFEFRWRQVADPFHQSTVIEPIHPLERREIPPPMNSI